MLPILTRFVTDMFVSKVNSPVVKISFLSELGVPQTLRFICRFDIFKNLIGACPLKGCFASLALVLEQMEGINNALLEG